MDRSMPFGAQHTQDPSLNEDASETGMLQHVMTPKGAKKHR